MNLPFAEKLNFWKTGNKAPGRYIEKAIKLITESGGTNIFESYGSHNGKAHYMIAFQLGEDKFKLLWPVLPTKHDTDQLAAKRQAATMLYHDVKNKCLKALIFGFRSAFFDSVMIADGRNLSEVSNQELNKHISAIEYKKKAS